jgi:hypothetical protein
MNEIIRTLKDMQNLSNKLDPAAFAVALLASLAAALLAGLLYKLFYESRGTGSQVHRAFPLLGISITALFIGVQVSLPLSLGLLGALSIIRFRTPIKEPEEVGFIMLVIGSSICCATFNFQFMVILNAIALVTLLLLRWVRLSASFGRDGLLILSMPEQDAARALSPVTAYLARHTRHNRLETSASHDGMTSIQFSFSGLKTDVAAFQTGLGELGPNVRVNLFFNRPGGMR